ncbi:hypothetical protein JXA85_01785 [Candidatus Woesearchaeota archaeon]|nr:hypothetical protein [Candidatus Woesearchaeota archaeon]
MLNNKAGYILFMAFYLVFEYISYGLLTTLFIFILAPVLILILLVKPDFSFSFLGIFSFLNPPDAAGTFTVGSGDLLLDVMLLLTLAVMAIGEGIKYLLRKKFQLEIPKIPFMGILLVASIIYAVIFIIGNDIRLQIVFFYLFTVACYFLLKLVNRLKSFFWEIANGDYKENL